VGDPVGAPVDDGDFGVEAHVAARHVQGSFMEEPVVDARLANDARAAALVEALARRHPGRVERLCQGSARVDAGEHVVVDIADDGPLAGQAAKGGAGGHV
tara:strand:+ start:2765 stop:3064 length:300 start_codon:yes stop_codon:yes gene_type:complete